MNVLPQPSFWPVWLLFLLATLGSDRAMGQPLIDWDRTLGGENYEELSVQIVLSDGILIGGSSRSNLAFGNPTDLSWNMFVAKLDLEGHILWRHMYGGLADERLWALVPTSDGGFLAGGHSFSGANGDKTQPSRGGMDVWLIKLNAQGQMLWDKTYGGLYNDELFGIRSLPNGNGYILGCHSWSDVSGEKSEPSRGQQDFWILQIDAQGNKLWDKTIGGDGYEQINDLEWAADGNLYLSGGTISAGNTGELGAEPSRGGMDFLLIKFNPITRQVIWTHRYGGTGEDYPYALLVASSGNLLLGGRSGSMPAPATAFDNGKEAPFYGGDSDYWLLELTPEGQKLREWSFGGNGLDDLYTIQENEIGQIVLGGVSDSGLSGNKTVGSRGGYDYWLIGWNSAWQPTWQLPVGGTKDDALTQITRLPDGALLLGGHSGSNAGFDKTEACAGGNDLWSVATRCETTVQIVPVGKPDCAGGPLHLSLHIQDCDSCYVLWSNGSTNPTIEATTAQPNTVSVVVFNEFGCLARDTFQVQPLAPPTLDLGPAEITLLQGSSLTLGQPDPNLHYKWNTGDTTATIQVTTAGFYAVVVTNAYGCTASDAVRVTLEDRGVVWVPNVFSPNDDGDNDYLPIFANHGVRRIVAFQINDRWGNLCFRRDDFVTMRERDGWDGTFRGKPVDIGVYVWFAIAEYLDGSRQLLEGSVTVLR